MRDWTGLLAFLGVKGVVGIVWRVLSLLWLWGIFHVAAWLAHEVSWQFALAFASAAALPCMGALLGLRARDGQE